MAKKKYSFVVKAGENGSYKMFYSDGPAENRCIGHLRGDFGKSGDEFWHSWFPHAADARNDEPFKNELKALVDFLRKSFLKSRVFMQKYLREHDSLMLESGIFVSRGYMVVTEQYEYYIRCSPQPGEYNFYIYAYVREGV